MKKKECGAQQLVVSGAVLFRDLAKFLPKLLFSILLLSVITVSCGDKKNKEKSHELAGRPLKILFALGCFPLLPETFIVNQLTGLIDRGHDIAIYSSHPGQVKVHPDVERYKLLKRTYYGKLPADIAKYDIILCQFGPLGKKFLKIKEELGLKAKIVTCFRGYDITQEVKEKGKHVYDSLFEKGDLFLPVCDYFKKIMIGLGCPREKIVVHHSAINLDRFAYNNSAKSKNIRLVSVNRLVAKKGTMYAIKAVASLLKKYPNLQYHIMGDGIMRRQLSRLIAQCRAGHAIKLLGWGNHDEVAKLLKTADIFLLPSLTDRTGNEEGIPNALKEAMAVGVPVISTHHAGIAELVEHGKSGFLVPPGNAAALADKIEYLIQHQQERTDMGLASRAIVEREYDTDILNDQLIALFYKLLTDPA
jgi:colanic acid/amylovoran biosynthesis glycosyltransferase